jgi:hypothetical protein
MKQSFLLLVSITAFALYSCKKNETTDQQPDVTTFESEASIPWQDCVTFMPQGLTICFVDALESRCPCDAICVWEGLVSATLKVTTSAGIDTTITLATNSSPEWIPNNKAIINGDTIQFIRTEHPTLENCSDYGNYPAYKAVIGVGN